MRRLNAHFRSFDEISLSDLFRSVGVYVIWDARQIARPSYIGEGRILNRFAVEHASRFSAPINGYAAVLGDTSRQSDKLDAVALEGVLLFVGEITDCFPTVNAATPSTKALNRLVRRHGTLRFAISGC